MPPPQEKNNDNNNIIIITIYTYLVWRDGWKWDGNHFRRREIPAWRRRRRRRRNRCPSGIHAASLRSFFMYLPTSTNTPPTISCVGQSGESLISVVDFLFAVIFFFFIQIENRTVKYNNIITSVYWRLWRYKIILASIGRGGVHAYNRTYFVYFTRWRVCRSRVRLIRNPYCYHL